MLRFTRCVQYSAIKDDSSLLFDIHEQCSESVNLGSFPGVCKKVGKTYPSPYKQTSIQFSDLMKYISSLF